MMIWPVLTLPSNGLFVSFFKSSTTFDKSLTNFSFIPFWVCIGVIYKCIQVGYCMADKSQPFFFISSPKLYTLNLSDLKATIGEKEKQSKLKHAGSILSHISFFKKILILTNTYFWISHDF